MTNPTPTTTTPPRRRSSLYRTVLGVAVAALLAAWLPFSVMYVNAVQKSAVASVTLKAGHPVLTTKTSGGQVVQTAAPASAGKPVQTAVPVTTRAS
jgi:hypothetical protein